MWIEADCRHLALRPLLLTRDDEDDEENENEEKWGQMMMMKKKMRMSEDDDEEEEIWGLKLIVVTWQSAPSSWPETIPPSYIPIVQHPIFTKDTFLIMFIVK